MIWLDIHAVEAKLRSRYLCVNLVRVVKRWPAALDVTIIGRQPVLKFIPAWEASPPAELSVDSPIFKQLQESTAAASLSAQMASDMASTDYLADARPYGGPLLSDATGLFYAPDTGANVPTVILIEPALQVGSKIDQVKLQAILQITQKLKELALPIRSFTVKQSTAVLKSDNPVYLLFTLNSGISRELASLQLILRQNTIDSKLLESIDFRFDRPVVTNSSK